MKEAGGLRVAGCVRAARRWGSRQIEVAPEPTCTVLIYGVRPRCDGICRDQDSSRQILARHAVIFRFSTEDDFLGKPIFS